MRAAKGCARLRGWSSHVRIQRGGGVRTPPLSSYKNIGFFSNTILVRIPLKSQSYQSSIQCWTSIGPPAKRHLNGVSLAGRLWPANSGIWILPPLIKLKKQQNKNVFKVGPPLTKLSGSAHASRRAGSLKHLLIVYAIHKAF